MNNWLALFDGQSRYVLEIHDSPVHPDVLRFYGREALSEPFTWDIEFTTEQANLAPGQVLMKFVDKLEIMENGEFKSCYLNFSDLTAIDLEKKSQFNYIKIGSTLWEKATDDLDDVYGALGSFIIKVAFTDLHVTRDSSGFVRLEIKELGLYVRDTHDFINDGDDQLLGYWGSNGVIKPGVISELMKKRYIDKENERYFRVTNSSFLSYRKKFKNTNKSGDFFVYTTVKKIPTNIVIHLNKVDMEEYFSWRKENANG